MITLNRLIEETKKELSFTIRAERINDVERFEQNGLFYFYIRIFLARVAPKVISSSSASYSSEDQQLDYNDIKYVVYNLDPTFPQPIRKSDTGNQFEIKIWTYGFFKVTANIFTNNGAVFTISDVPISFEVSEEEKKKNGSEVVW